jgi:hypothetical protein
MIFPQNAVGSSSKFVQMVLLDRAQSGNSVTFFFINGSEVAADRIEFGSFSRPLPPHEAPGAPCTPLYAL